MINILIGFLSAATIFSLLFFLVTAGYVWSSLAGVVVFIAVNYLLGKRILARVTAIMESTGKIIQKGKFEAALKTLEEGLKYSKWMIMVDAQIRSQMGIILYLKKDYNAAQPYLEKTVAKNWMAIGMLGVIYMRKKEKEKMIKIFQKGVKSNSDEAIMWNLYAYCLNKIDEKDKAIEVLTKAKKKLGDDVRTTANLKALQNNAKMKMRSFGDLWYQFYLENIPMNVRVQAGARGAKRGKKMQRR